MKHKIDETEYMFACAKIRAMEASLPNKARLDRIIDSTGADSAILLKDCGIDISLGIDKAINAKLRTVCEELESVIPNSDIVKIFMYQYDCNNVKAAIKCARLGKDFADIEVPCGTLSAEQLEQAVAKNDFSALPKNMAKAAAEATEAFAATSDPLAVDVLLDKACFLDVLEATSPYERILEFVKTKIDVLNMLISLRLIRMGGSANDAVLSETLLPGGDIEKSEFAKAVSLGEESLFALMRGSKLRSLAESILSAGNKKITLGEIEKEADDYFIRTIKETRFIPFGPEIIYSYITGLEYALKNVRIVLAGKEAGLLPELIRQKLRESYV